MKVPIEIGSEQDQITSGTIVGWLKEVGDFVHAGESVVEIELEKVVVEVPATVDGILVEIVHNPDDTVASGTVLGFIDDGTT